MSKLSRIFACVALAFGLALAAPGAAQAQHWHHGGEWYGFGPGLALGFSLSAATPHYYPPSHYRPPRSSTYRPPRCGWVRTRYWYYGRWRWRRVWRCW